MSAPDTAGAAAGGPASPLAPAYRLLTILLVAMVTMVAFESMAVSTAMPAVAADLHAVREFGLAFSFMLSAMLLGIVVCGLWCDRDGPVPPLLVGQALFAAGSLACGFAHTLGVLLTGRIVTGIGGGLLVTALYVAIGRAYPGDMHPKVFGWISAAWVLPAIVGPLVAGALTEHASWRWVFWCVVPIGVVTTCLSFARRAAFGGPTGADARSAAAQLRVAGLGAVLAVSAGALQWGSSYVRPFAAVPVAVGVLGLAGVALTGPRLVPRGTLRMARGLPSVMLSRFLLTAAFNGAMTFIPLMLVAERGLSTTAAGVVLMLGSVGWSGGSVLQARSLPLDKPALLSLGGLLVGAGGALLAAVAWLGLPVWAVPVAVVLDGLGMGLAMSTIGVLALELTPVAEHGRMSSSLQLSDSLGSALGVALTGAVFATRHVGAGHDEPTYTLLWAACAVIGGLVWFAGHRTRP